jgi:hypothetical protein
LGCFGPLDPEDYYREVDRRLYQSFVDNDDFSIYDYWEGGEASIIKSAVHPLYPLHNLYSDFDDHRALVWDDDYSSDSDSDDIVALSTENRYDPLEIVEDLSFASIISDDTEYLLAEIFDSCYVEGGAVDNGNINEDNFDSPIRNLVDMAHAGEIELLDKEELLDKMFKSVMNNVEQLFRDSTSSNGISSFAELQSNMPSHVDIAEGFIILGQQLHDAQSAAAVAAAFVAFARRFTDRSVSETMVLYLPTLSDTIFDEFSGWKLQSSSEQPTVLKYIDMLVDGWRTTRDSRIVKNLNRLFLFALSYKLLAPWGFSFESLNYNQMERAYAKRETAATNMFEALAETVQWVLRTGWQVWSTGIMSTFFHDEVNYAKIFEEGVELQVRVNERLSKPAGADDSTKLIADVQDHVDKLYQMKEMCQQAKLKEASGIAGQWSMWRLRLSDLIQIEQTRKQRVQPYGVHLFGPPGHGKSNMTNLIFKTIGGTMGYPIDTKHMYYRSLEKHWNGYASSHWCIVFDDAGQVNPANAQSDPMVDGLIVVCNNAPTSLEQADISDKGKTPCLAKLVIVTSNAEHINADKWFTTPLAVHRRMHIKIEVIAKPEYCTNGRVDSSKCPLDKGLLSDIWNFKVFRVEPDSSHIKDGMHKNVLLFATGSIAELLNFVAEDARAHYAQQEVMLSKFADDAPFRLCEKCNKIDALCSCALPQVSVVETIGIITMCTYLAGAIPNLVAKYTTFWILSCIYRKFCSFKNQVFGIIRWPWGPRSKDLRAVFVSAGRGVASSYLVPTAIALLGTTVAGGYFLARMRNKLSLQATEKAPTVKTKPRSSPYPTFDPVGVKLELSEASRGSRGQLQKKEELISRACIRVVCNSGNKMTEFRALGVGGNLYLTNNHCLPEGPNDYELHVISGPVDVSISQNVHTSLSAKKIERDVDNDLCVFQLDCLPPRTDITKYFPIDTNTSVLANYLVRWDDGSIKKVHCTGSTHRVYKSIPLDTTIEIYQSTVRDIEPFNGMCGSPLVADSPQGPFIAGIHVVGERNLAGATLVKLPILKKLMDKFGPTIKPGVPMLSRDNRAPEELIKDLHPKSTLQFVEGAARVYGSLSCPSVHPRSRVEPSVACEILEAQYGMKRAHGAPVMSGRRHWVPKHLSLKPLTAHKPVIPAHYYDAIREAVFNKLTSQLKPDDIEMMHVVTTDVALNGADGVPFVDAVPRSTSMGFPHNSKKMNFMVFTSGDRVEFIEEIAAIVADVEQRMRKGERIHPVFNAALKDEPRPFEKIEQGNTRVFSGSPIVWGLNVRKYLLWLVRLVQHNTILFESGPGTRCQSSEWGDIYRYITKFGTETMVAGDYKKFDKNMSPEIIKAVYELIIDLAEWSGNFDAEDILAMRTVAEDSAFPLTNYFGDLVEFFGSNPSGHPLTVIINGFVNAFYMRCAWMMIQDEMPVSEFDNHVALMTYGDDNVMGVSPLVPWFNHTAISKALSSVGVTYTMADKDADSVPFIPVEEISFLKRKFVYSEELGDYAAPLELASIERSLLVNVRSQTITKEAQFIACCASAVREYFFHGRDVFEEKTQMLKKVIDQLNISGLVEKSTFPSWESLVRQWRENSKLED